MLMIISPAKTLDMSPVSCANVQPTTPQFMPQVSELVTLMREYDADAIAALMHVSDKIATLNETRYREFPDILNNDNAKPALLAFQGDVYRPIKADMYNASQCAFAQQHLRILSGLYGVLRPFDYMYPYRLEMGTRLKNAAGKDLYHFWGEHLAHALNDDIAANHSPFVLNLASNEYSKAVKQHVLDAPMIQVSFKEQRGDELKIIGIHAKRARGLMVDMIIRDAVTSLDDVRQFDEAGYGFRPDLSDVGELVFTRNV